jgi:hypothetical protein
MSKVRFVGLDVHAETIAVAVAGAGRGEVHGLGTIANRPESVRKLIGKLGGARKLRCCYEAGPTVCSVLAAGAVGRGVRGDAPPHGIVQSRRDKKQHSD